MSLLELFRCTTTQELESIRSEWSRLYEECEHATPFQSPEWLLPWWRHLGGGDLLLLGVRRQGKLVGLAPLFFHIWEGRRQLSPLGVSISDYTDFLFLPKVEKDGVDLVLKYLAGSPDEWDVCILPDVPFNSALPDLKIPKGVQARLEPSEVCPVLRLPDGEKAFADSLPPHLLRNLRLGRNWLERSGPVEVRAASQEAVAEHMDELFRLHEARWRQRRQPGVLSSASLKAFHQEAAKGLGQRGALTLHALWHAERIKAVAYGFTHGGRAAMYLTGFDPTVKRGSPGLLLTFHVIQETIRKGFREFDFLRGSEVHKYAWGARDRQNYRLTLYH